MDTTPTRLLDAHFVVDANGLVQLKATVCERCGSRWFPARVVCAQCRNSPLETRLIGPAGAVYAATVVRTGSSDFSMPYSLAYLDIDDVRVLAQVAGGTATVVAPVAGTGVQLQLRAVENREGQSTYVAVPDAPLTASEGESHA